MVIVAYGFAFGRKYSYAEAFLAMSYICLVYEMSNLDHAFLLYHLDSIEELATLLNVKTVATGRQQDR
jgi:hypothetical protein